MQLDRLKQTQFMAFQIGLITLSFLKLLKVPERGWFTKVFRPFSFVANEEARQSQSADHTGEKSACGIGRFGTGNAPVRQTKPYTRSLLALR